MKSFLQLSIAIVLFISSTSCKQQAKLLDGKIIFMSGIVQVNNEKAKINQEISSGDKIITDKNSICEIIFNDKNIIKIKENSSVILASNKIEIEKGAMFNILKKLDKSEENKMLIYTPTTIAAIRGTSFFVKIEDKDNTYFCDCNGIIGLSNKDKSKKIQVEAKHHKAYRLTKNKDSISIKEAKMLYHNDDEMEALAFKIGTKIEWDRIDGK